MDSQENMRARAVWVELTLFPKAVLRAEKRGIRQSQAYARARNRLERWTQGERVMLWAEALRDVRVRKSKGKAATSDRERLDRADVLASKSGESWEGYSGVGLAGACGGYEEG